MVAILLATYNGENYLREQLDSLVGQTCRDFCVYIHDDGSDDKTMDIINDYISRYPDVFKYVNGEKTGGSKENFLFLLDKVSADYYMFCDQDDVWLPNKVEISLAEMHKMEKTYKSIPLLVFSDMRVVDEKLETIDKSFMHYCQLAPNNLEFNNLVVENTAAGCTMLFNRMSRDYAVRFHDLDLMNDIRFHDWWVMVIVSCIGKVRFIDEKLSLYRQHGNNSIGAFKEIGLIKKLKMLWWTVTFSHVSRTKERINNFVRQGAALYFLPLKGENRKIVIGLGKFYEMNKIQRIRFVRRFKLYRSKRNLWQQICL